MIYIASPYSSPFKSVMEERYYSTLQFTYSQLRSGKPVFSPIVHCHEMAKILQIDGTFKTWQDYNLAMLKSAHALYVFCLTGWQNSIGVTEEIAFAKANNIHMVFWNEDGLHYRFFGDDEWQR